MNSNNDRQKCDVLVIGASMAGLCLARQLKLRHDDMNIVMIDKKREFDYGIGESMLEIFWDYAARDLKLGPYLDYHYISKHGLRFFFDSPAHDQPLAEMSEMGRAWDDAIPAHQINRKRFDEDLYRMNLESGIDIRLGCTASGIEIDAEQGHVVTTADGQTIRCRWLVDASGLQAPLARKLELLEPVVEHPVSSRWMRVRNIRLIDEMGPDSWRERVRFNSRFRSTNHFMYPGYWIWLIALDDGLFSIGIVWHHAKADIEIKSSDDFVRFLRSHRAIADLFGDDFEVVDYHGLKNMARMADRFFSEDRWFLTGMSAAFLDPLFSSGSAFLSDANRMIVDLIETDMAGDRDAMRNKAVCYTEHMRWWLKNFLLHISGNYHGSFDLLRHLFEPLLMDYFGLILPVSMLHAWGYEPGKDYGNGRELRRMKDQMILEGPAQRAHDITHQLADFLMEHEGIFSRNAGQYVDLKIMRNYNRHSLTRGATLNPQTITELHREMLEFSVRTAFLRMAQSLGRECVDAALPAAVSKVLDEGWKLVAALDICLASEAETEAALAA